MGGVADDQACFEQAGLYRDVGFSLIQALIDGAYAVTDFEADIPEQLYQLFQLGLQGGVRCVLQQDQDIDIGMRE